jgi:hypothetical protein
VTVQHHPGRFDALATRELILIPSHRCRRYLTSHHDPPKFAVVKVAASACKVLHSNRSVAMQSTRISLEEHSSMSSNTVFLLFPFPSCIVIVNKIITSSLHLIDSKCIIPRIIELRYHQGLFGGQRQEQNKNITKLPLPRARVSPQDRLLRAVVSSFFLSEQLRTPTIVNNNLQPVIQDQVRHGVRSVQHVSSRSRPIGLASAPSRKRGLFADARSREIHEPSQPYHIPPRGNSQPYRIPPRGSSQPYHIPPRHALRSYHIPPRQYHQDSFGMPLHQCVCGCSPAGLLGRSSGYQEHGRYSIPPPTRHQGLPTYTPFAGLEPRAAPRDVYVIRPPASRRSGIIETFFGTIAYRPNRRRIRVSVRC